MNKTASPAMGIIALVTVPVSYVWYGYVLSVLWAWFVVVPFEAPPLTIPVAIGISLIVGMLTASLARADLAKEYPDANQRVFVQIMAALVSPLLFLMIGWIVRMFI